MLDYSFFPSRSEMVSIEIWDILGTRVATIANKVFPAGLNAVRIDGSELSSGIYLVRILSAGDVVETRVMLLK